MFLLMLSVPGWAAPEFDIQLNELKKPSLPAVSKKRSPLPPEKPKANGEAANTELKRQSHPLPRLPRNNPR